MRSHFIPCAASWLLTAAFLAVMGILSWGVAHLILGRWITLILLALSLLSMAIHVFGAQRTLRRQLGARKLASGELVDIQDVIARLARAAGLRRAPELWYTPSADPNAHASGTRRRGFIAVSDGLLRTLSSRELVGVIGHEIAHIAHNDLWIMQGAEAMRRALSGVLRLAVTLFIPLLPVVFVVGVMPPWSLVCAALGYQIVMTALVQAISRTREFEADRVAALITRDPEALIASLENMTRASPPRWRNRIWPLTLFNSHPLIEERVGRLRRISIPASTSRLMGMEEPEPNEPVHSAPSVRRESRATGRPVLTDCPF